MQKFQMLLKFVTLYYLSFLRENENSRTDTIKVQVLFFESIVYFGM